MMTLPTGTKRNERGRWAFEPAFTLIELTLVMAMLTIVIGVAMPSLKGFFRGRSLDSEARRFLALTRYGQSRAVSEGVPMVLWIDARRGEYGLQTQAGYTDDDTNAVRFVLPDELRVEVQTTATAGAMTMPSSPLNQTIAGIGNVPMIRFTPDGFIGQASPDELVFRQGANDAIWILENTNRLNYAIRADQSYRR
jgi:type II secretion system protein H